MTDELKPVRCGCGGEAKVQRVRTLKSHVLVVMCTKCEIATNYYVTEAEAVQAWNRAMGAKDINVPNKFATDTNVGDKERTAKVSNQIFRDRPNAVGAWIGTCECGALVTYSNKYCSQCGCKLDWGS